MGRTLLRNGTHLLALSGFAIAKPLYDFIETDPSSLVVDDVTGGALVVMALVLLLLPPLLLLAVEAVAAQFGETWLERVHLVMVGLLVALFVLQARTSIGLLPESFPALAPIAVALGAGAALLYRRAEIVRTYLTVLAVAPVLFLGLFLFAGEASPLVTDVEQPERAPALDQGGAPVVLLMFDELPLNSILDSAGGIDEARYPNFARFAQDATWYRNTVSVEAFTPWAIPAVLDGKRPRAQAYSHPAFHPESLFTLLGASHELHVREAFTRVCPKALCPRDEGGFLARGVRGFDGLVHPFWSRLVPGRPAEYAGKATQKVRALLGAETQATAPGDTPQIAEVRSVLDERVPSFEAFLEDLEPGDKPGLFYQHLLLPHAPFEFTADGRQYRFRDSRLRDDVWDRERSLTRLGWRRHLLQMEYTDRLLGRMLDRLQETPLYDEAAVAIVADHGAFFARGTDRRVPTELSLPFLAPVPFMLKAPGQTEGRVDDTPAETVDVLPTLADAIGVDVPYDVDGRSLAAGSAGAGRERVSMTFQGRDPVSVPRSAVALGAPAVPYRKEVGGEGADRRPLYAETGFAGLIGKALPAGRDVAADLDDTGAPRQAVQGTIRASGAGEGRVLAVGRCGRVVSVARTYRYEGRERFAALADPSVPGDCPPVLRLIR